MSDPASDCPGAILRHIDVRAIQDGPATAGDDRLASPPIFFDTWFHTLIRLCAMMIMALVIRYPSNAEINVARWWDMKSSFP